MSIETSIVVSVYGEDDPGYHYEITADRCDLCLQYIENISSGATNTNIIAFSNLNEMEAIATAMLKAVKFAREVQ